MRSKLRVIGALLSCGALVFFAACGGGSQSNECQFTSDCESGQVCYTGGQANQCVKECESSSDCNGRTCSDQVEGSSMGCMPKGGSGTDGGGMFTDGGMTDGGTTGCTDNSDCADGEVCNTQGDGPGMCETITQDPVEFVQITDVTSQEQGSCNSTGSDPGADLFGVELRDSDGNTLGWAKVASSNIKNKSSNDHTNPSVLNGQPDLSGKDGVCPPDFDGNNVALGCGGDITVSFTGSNGENIALENGQTIITYEYGNQCRPSGESGNYTQPVTVATCPRGTALSDFTSGSGVTCDNELGTGGGQLSTDVDLGSSN
jgi:hypothetical protein